MAGQEFQNTILSFYDAALGQVNWSKSLENFTALMRSNAAMMGLHDSVTRMPLFLVGEFAADPGYTESFAREYMAISPFPFANAVMSVGEAAKPFDLVGRERVLQGRFYKEWCAPQGYHDFAGVLLSRDTEIISSLAVVRTKDQPLFDADMLETINAIAPHAARALKMAGALESLRAEKQDVLNALDQVSEPVIIMGKHQNVLHANQAARNLPSSTATLTRNNFTLADPAAELELKQSTANGDVTPASIPIGVNGGRKALDVAPVQAGG
ncbi:MAG: hypothetical protein ACRCU5_01265, partial [Rhizobiaceae bacterium]